jgi:hypothetical protein
VNIMTWPLAAHTGRSYVAPAATCKRSVLFLAPSAEAHLKGRWTRPESSRESWTDYLDDYGMMQPECEANLIQVMLWMAYVMLWAKPRCCAGMVAVHTNIVQLNFTEVGTPGTLGDRLPSSKQHEPCSRLTTQVHADTEHAQLQVLKQCARRPAAGYPELYQCDPLSLV